MRLKVAALAFTVLGVISVNAGTSENPAVSSVETKLQHIEKNAESANPDQTPTVFTEQEINASFAAGKVKLPEGVQAVTFQGQPGVITASCRVDFDQVKAGRHSANPLLSLFSGVHAVVVTADASGGGGQGLVNVKSVLFDGVEIPRFVLELFVEKYVQPKYPKVGLDSRFSLPDKVDTAVVGSHDLTLTQK